MTVRHRSAWDGRRKWCNYSEDSDLSSNLFDLTGKAALITGSSKGIGKAIAEEMARQGAQVVISSRKGDVCQAVADAINAECDGEPGGAIAIPAHIGDKAALEMLVAETREKLGKIDILVCNAAVNPFYGSMTDLPDSAFDKILDINIKSNHWLCQMVLPEMKERQDGAIVIVSSVGGLRGSTDLGAYCDFQGGRSAAGTEPGGGARAGQRPRQRDIAGSGPDRLRARPLGESGHPEARHGG